MGLSYNKYWGDGNETDYVINFPYINKSHVKAYVNAVLTPFTWVTSSTIRFSTPPGLGLEVHIRRETPYLSRLVEFQNGALLNEDDLNLAATQLFYGFQELQESEAYLRGIQGEKGDPGTPGADGGQGPPGQDGTPSPWANLNELLTALTGQLEESHLYNDLNTRINMIDIQAFTVGCVEDGIIASLTQNTAEASAAVGIATIILDSTRGEITTLGQVTQSGEYGWITHNGLGLDSYGNPIQFIDGESLTFSPSGATAKYSAVGSTPTKIYLYDVSATLPAQSDFITGVTSGANCQANANYSPSGGLTRMKTAEEKLSAAELTWFVKLQLDTENDVVVAGVGLDIDEATSQSEFMVLSNKFTVVNPSLATDKKQVFTVGTIDGVTGQVGIKGDLLVDGTVIAKAIKTGEVFTQTLHLGTANRFKLDGANTKLVINDGTYDRVEIGKYDGSNYGLRLKDASGNITLETSDTMKQKYMKIDQMNIIQRVKPLDWVETGTFDNGAWLGSWDKQMIVGVCIGYSSSTLVAQHTGRTGGKVNSGWTTFNAILSATYTIVPGIYHCWFSSPNYFSFAAACQSTTNGIYVASLNNATHSWVYNFVLAAGVADGAGNYQETAISLFSNSAFYLWWINPSTGYIRCSVQSNSTNSQIYAPQNIKSLSSIDATMSHWSIAGVYGPTLWVWNKVTGHIYGCNTYLSGGALALQTWYDYGAIIATAPAPTCATVYCPTWIDASAGPPSYIYDARIYITCVGYYFDKYLVYKGTTKQAEAKSDQDDYSGRSPSGVMYPVHSWGIEAFGLTWPYCASRPNAGTSPSGRAKWLALGLLSYVEVTNATLEEALQKITLT